MIHRARYLISQFRLFFRDLYQSRQVILEFTARDITQRYLGAYLGLAWAFVNPVVTILVFWFVFSVGFKSQPVNDFPFILWLTSGMIPWFCFSEAVSSASESVIENRFLVNKVVFRVSTLPVVKILSALFIHTVFIAITLGLFLMHGFPPDIHVIQIPYYTLAMATLVLGISWITSAIIIFIRDVKQIVAIVLQFGFWLTPIFWSMNLLPPRYQAIMRFNPVFYITEGYRDSLINGIWFWERPAQGLAFWGLALVTLGAGAVFFRKLRPHFADVI